MNRTIQHLFIAALAGIVLAGCGSGDNTDTSRAPKNIQEATEKMETVFKGAAPEVTDTVTGFNTAIKDRQFEAAVDQLEKFNNIPTLTYEQAVAIKQSRDKLVESIARNIDKDPAAKRAWERMKASARDH